MSPSKTRGMVIQEAAARTTNSPIPPSRPRARLPLSALRTGPRITGHYPVPFRHGMTPGEIARYVNGEYRVGADLRVVYRSFTVPGFPQGEQATEAAFAAAAATIVAGAMAERTQFRGYLLYSVFITGLIYPVVVNWQWGGGWLSQLGTPFEDFAGSSIVHSVGGWAAMMGALIIGPRIGKYGPDGKPRPMPGHSMALTVIGVFILFVGWFGFNPGSQLAADIEVPRIAVNTALTTNRMVEETNAFGEFIVFSLWFTALDCDV